MIMVMVSNQPSLKSINFVIKKLQNQYDCISCFVYIISSSFFHHLVFYLDIFTQLINYVTNYFFLYFLTTNFLCNPILSDGFIRHNNIQRKFEAMERKHWTPQEDKILEALVQDIGYLNWTLVSYRLAQKCKKYLRTGKQCRQRWFNHLDKNINKYSWTDGQEQMIFQMHKVYGNKWKQIAKCLQNRTQNAIKNHFYAVLRKGIRRMNKFIGFKKNPNQIRTIKPSILSQICLKQKQFSQVHKNKTGNGIVDLIYKFSKTQQNLAQIDKIIQNQQIMQIIQNVLQLILQKNFQYQDKQSRKKQIAIQQKKNKIKSKNQSIVIGQQQYDISDFLCLNPNRKIIDQDNQNKVNNQKQEQILSSKSSLYLYSFVEGDQSNLSDS